MHSYINLESNYLTFKEDLDLGTEEVI